jgi:hypothetical protein
MEQNAVRISKNKKKTCIINASIYLIAFVRLKGI